MLTIKNIATSAYFLSVIRLFGLFFLSAGLFGCAVAPNANPQDPFEPFNRRVSKFNEGMDDVIFKPTAQAYKAITPTPVRTGVNNFFNNLKDVWTAVNAALQLKAHTTVESSMRVATNTVFGFGGIIDLASEIGMERHVEDFGQTLGRWGVKPGPYVVLPFFGPSTVRDSLAMSVDLTYGDALGRINHIPTRNQAKLLNLVDTRTQLLGTSRMIDEVALDKYSFVRDAYLQRRAANVKDGNTDDESTDASPAAATPPQDPPPDPPAPTK